MLFFLFVKSDQDFSFRFWNPFQIRLESKERSSFVSMAWTNAYVVRVWLQRLKRSCSFSQEKWSRPLIFPWSHNDFSQKATQNRGFSSCVVSSCHGSFVGDVRAGVLSPALWTNVRLSHFSSLNIFQVLFPDKRSLSVGFGRTEGTQMKNLSKTL